MMKKWFVGLALLLCLVLCCAGGLADAVHVTDFQEFFNALNAGADNIALDNSISLDGALTINRDVKILYGNDVSIQGSGTLTIAEGCTVTMGADVGNTTNRPFDGNVYVDVVNHGTLQGSTTFQGKVTNDGNIAAAHCFLGEYEDQGGSNSSYVYLEFDFGGVIVQEYESTGSSGTTTVRGDKIYGKVICGQKPKNGIVFNDTDRWVSDIVKAVDSQLVVTREGFDLTWLMEDGNAFDIDKPLVSASTKNVVISAKWSVKEGYTLHTLTFDANGGTGTMEPLKFVTGETLKLSEGARFSRKTEEGSNYSFLGWNTAQDGKGHAYSSKGETITLGDEDVTLYAQWTSVTSTDGLFSVTYHSNNGSTPDIVGEESSLKHTDSPRLVKSSDDFPSMTPPSDDKFFAGWSFNQDGSGTLLQAGDRVTLIDGGEGGPGVHLYAVWESKYIDVSNESELRAAVQDTSGKTIRLLDRITLTQNLTIANNVTIDMYGHSIMGSDLNVQVNEGYTLTLMNSTTTGISGVMNPTVKNNGTIKMQDAVIFKVVKQGGKGSIDHTPRNEYFPHIDCIYVQTSSQLESALGLTISDYPHVDKVFLDKDITLANNATLPANMRLNLNGHTLSGSKTLTLASSSTVTDNEGKTGCVTCTVNDKGANISDVAVTVTYKSGIASVTNPTAQTIIRGQKATKPTDPTHEDFTFQHWSKQGETTEFDFDASMTASTTLVAQWDAIPVSDEDELRAAVASNPSKPLRLLERITLTSDLTIAYNVTIDMNGNSIIGNGPTIQVNEGCTLSLLNTTDTGVAGGIYPTVNNNGTLKLRNAVYLEIVKQGEKGSIDHTPNDEYFPHIEWVYVQTSSQLESTLGLTSSEYPHVGRVRLEKDITLANDATLPANMRLNLNGHTLSGTNTLTLASGSTVTDNEGNTGCVTCTVDDKGANITDVAVTVTFDNGEADTANPADQTFIRGQKATEPVAPTKEGHVFDGWYNGETVFDFTASVMADTALTAKWIANTYTVTFDVDGVTTAANVQHGNTVDKPADPAKEGCTFAGWYNGETAYDFTTPVTAAMTLTAKWTDNIYTVTFDVDGVTTTANVQHGNTVDKPTDPAKEGCTFAGWYKGETAYDFTTPVTAGLTLTAKWTDNIYTVTFDVDGTTTTANVQHGNTVDKPTDPTKEGCTFAGWYKGETAYDFTTPVTAAMTLTAKWTDNIYTVTFDVDGVTTTANVQHGNMVTRPDDPTKKGFVFTCWLADGQEFDFTAPITASVTLKAQWQEAEAPTINGLVDGKTYCGPVTFYVRASMFRAIEDVDVTVNGTALYPNTRGAYTLQPAEGPQKVVATNAAGKSIEATVTVNDGHTWSQWTSNGDGTHTHACAVGGCTETEEANCAGGTATCSEKAQCEQCGSAYGTTDASAHDALTHVPEKDSTTTEAGNSEYWYCQHCKKYYADAAATQEIAQADTVLPLQPEVPKTGDSAPLALWVCLMLLGLGGLAAMGKRSHN